MAIPADSRFRFLIVGAGRSGTSLLTALLDQHSRLEVGFEVGSIDCLRGRALVDEPARLFQQRTGAFVERCIAAAAESSAAMWGNKITTEQLAGLNKHNLYHAPPLDILDAFFNNVLAELRVIYLLRDGRACVQSKLARTAQSLEQACESWRYAVAVYEFLQQRPNTLFLRFEDLVLAPERELGRVLEFLGVEFEPAIVSGEGTMHPGMPPAYRRPGIDPGRATDLDTAHPCVALIAPELRRCGYH
ncbi:sulfotransferase [Haliea sp. E1-2-M8]|uniref:sulfotransferase family protein n=1 Tax=Haliea sp. E1-2-M8 TaxID=3064706 RepID=UPI002718A2B1|nr:sulfotransferase [Haliea sp. E1-2-M8]MDO8861186.1 sulfotransferase [Haliea sp. E1-2-M8]